MSVLRDSPHLTDHDDGMVDEYQALSGWAVAALILGLLGPFALVNVWLTLIPLLGVVAAAVALVRVAMLAPALTGRKVALAGLFLSILFTSAAAADRIAYWRAVDLEARRFAEAWFAFLSVEQPHKAHQLTLAPRYRQPLDDKLPEFYREGEPWHDELQSYVEQPVVRKLLALGERARVRYDGTEAHGSDTRFVGVRQRFSVTYHDADHGRRTFFVSLGMQRLPLEQGEAAWRLVNAEEVEPEAAAPPVG